MLGILRWIDAIFPNLGSQLNKRSTVVQSDAARSQREFQRFLLSLVGVSAIALIPLVIIADGLIAPGCVRDSLSHYAYSPFSGTLFVVAMSAVGVLLFAYKGEMPRDTRIARTAGVAALVIAVFSTSNVGFDAGETCDVLLRTRLDLMAPLAPADAPDGPIKTAAVPLTSAAIEPFDGIEWLHYGGVAVLFGAMIFFCLFIFRLASAEDKDADGRLKPIKVYRNFIYLICGFVLIGCGIWLGTSFWMTETELAEWNARNTTLWIEIISFFVLGVAWLIKGRFFNRPWLMS